MQITNAICKNFVKPPTLINVQTKRWQLGSGFFVTPLNIKRFCDAALLLGLLPPQLCLADNFLESH